MTPNRLRFLGRKPVALSLALLSLLLACGDATDEARTNALDPADGGAGGAEAVIETDGGRALPSPPRVLDPKDYESTVVTVDGRAVTVAVPRVALTKEDVAIVVNSRDPQSVAVAAMYEKKRAIPAGRRIEVDFDPAVALTAETWKPLRAAIDAKANALGGVEAYAVSFTAPWQVAGMSITSALTFGFDPKYVSTGTCSPTAASPLYDADTSRPFTTHGLRPAMALAGEDFAKVEALVTRAVSGDRTFPIGTGYFVKTTDAARSTPRLNGLRGSVESLGSPWGPFDLHYVDSTSATTDFVANASNVLFYFTGATNVANLDTVAFVPGALADHLTSFGGVLRGGSQMSAVRWLEAGASASYGTVREPCNYVEKFPDPRRVTRAYVHGATALSAYVRGVAWPGEGVLVGDPLARPFGAKVGVVGSDVSIAAGALRGGHRYSLLAGDSWAGPWETRKAWVPGEKVAFETVTTAGDRPVVVLVDDGPEPLPSVVGDAGFHVRGQTLVTTHDGELWLTELGHVAPRRLAWWRPSTSNFALASDGKRVAWIPAGRMGRIELEDLVSRERRTLNLPPNGATPASISGLAIDGDRVAWSDDHEGSKDIYVYRWSTKETARLTTDPADQHSPSLSKDRIVWSDERSGAPRIWIHDFATGESKPVPTTPPASFSDGDVSLDGDRLVWSRGSDVSYRMQIWTMDLAKDVAARRVLAGRDSQSRATLAGDRTTFCDTAEGRSQVWEASSIGARRLTPFEGSRYCETSTSPFVTAWMDAEAGVVRVLRQPGFVDGVVFEAPSDATSARPNEILVRHVRAADPATTFEATLLGGGSIGTLGGALTLVAAGDVDGDGAASASDAAFVSARLGSRRGEAAYDARADLDDDGRVDARDVAAQASDAKRGGKVGVFTLPTPANLAAAPLVVQFVARRGSETSTAAVRFDANGSPVISGPSNVTVAAGQAVSFLVYASDPDESDAVEDFGAPAVLASLGAKVTLGPLGDLNGDGVANALDLAKFRAFLGSVRGDAKYWARADFDADGDIDAEDQAILVAGMTRKSAFVEWTPTAAQKGLHDFVFTAWDGRTEVVSRSTAVTVE